MKTSTIIWSIIAIVIIGGGVWYFTSGASGMSAAQMQNMPMATTTSANTPASQPASQPATQTSVTTSVTTTTTPAPSGTLAAQSFTVNGNDETADLKAITVPKGTPVTITFGADAGTTYHGGLDFRSSVISTGTITPGSTKTVSFVATQSFAFTPYWPSTNIAKPYTINVVVD